MSLCEQVFAKYNHTFIHTSPTHQEKTQQQLTTRSSQIYSLSCVYIYIHIYIYTHTHLRLNNLQSW